MGAPRAAEGEGEDTIELPDEEGGGERKEA